MGVTYRCWLGVNRGLSALPPTFGGLLRGDVLKSLWIARLIEQRIPMLSKLKSVLDQSIWDHTDNICYIWWEAIVSWSDDR